MKGDTSVVRLFGGEVTGACIASILTAGIAYTFSFCQKASQVHHGAGKSVAQAKQRMHHKDTQHTYTHTYIQGVRKTRSEEQYAGRIHAYLPMTACQTKQQITEGRLAEPVSGKSL